jgi:predicted RNase H-like HicB family nuclease
MKPSELLLHVYGERKDGQWTLMCLDFTLAVQADSLAEAEQLLKEQIEMYVREATIGQDTEHAGVLLKRKAPFKYWLKYYLFRTRETITHRRNSHIAKSSPIPMVPAA